MGGGGGGVGEESINVFYIFIILLSLKGNYLLWLPKGCKRTLLKFINNSNFVKNSPLRIVFSTLLSIFRYPDERLSLVFDIFLFKLVNNLILAVKQRK